MFGGSVIEQSGSKFQ
jgi:kinesin family protein 2/24